MSEATEQIALFEWSKWIANRAPELDLLLHIPNGEKRDKATAARLQRMGVRAGVPDVLLPVARAGKHGLWIELKDGRNRTTAFQDRWLTDLRGHGYACHVCYGWQAAARVIVDYLGLKPTDCGL